MNFGSYYEGPYGDTYKCIGRAYGSVFERDDIVLFCLMKDGSVSDVMYCSEEEFVKNFREV